MVFTIDGSELAVKVANQALKEANTKPEEIGKIVFATDAELQSPGVEVILIDELGLPRNVSKNTINLTGCGAGLSGLALLNDYCIANPGKDNFF